MDIQVIKRPMGASAQSCKGFFLVSSRCKLIVINSDLPESIQRIIIAHELGHAVLHSDSAISAFHEFAMFDDTDRMEYEANVFAADGYLRGHGVAGDALFFSMPSCILMRICSGGHQDQCPLHRAWGFSQARSGAASQFEYVTGQRLRFYA